MSGIISRRHSFSRAVVDEEESRKLGYISSLPIYLQTYEFEISNEVVNKVGGIHTVLRTKAGVSVEGMDYKYFMVGILKEQTLRTEVDVTEPPTAVLGKTLAEMRASGYKIAYGRWLIEGYPQVILFDLGSAAYRLDDWKRELWSSSRIGIHLNDHEVNDAVIFGALVTEFLGIFSRNIKEDESLPPTPVVAHFHEWMAGIGLLFCRTRHLDVATVFTTHATLLGRHLCAGSEDFYNRLQEFDVDREAGRRDIYNRYCMERAASHCAHVFTTVSEITGFEAQHLLKRKPDIITPNGLNVVKFAALHEFQNMHALAKEKIHRFIQGHFYGHYDFDLDKTIYLFTAGRYEFGNKGADMFIESLARLNGMLKNSGSDITVVAFVIFPAQTANFNVESFRAQAIVKQLRDTVDTIQKNIGHRLFELCLRGKLPSGDDILTKADKVQLKRCMYAAQRHELPPICTHNVVNDGADPVLNNLRRCQLFNHTYDRVKIIFHPEFLSSSNPLLPMDYEEFVRGCHLGVFPSYYEPWGYTPAECTVMGIPSITTNLSGFGCFIQTHVEDPSSYGIYIVDRRYRSTEESVQQLSGYMFNFCQLNRRKRVILRNRCERLSDLLDWRNLVIYYKKARLMALTKQYPEWFDPASSRDDRDERGSVKSMHISRPGSAPSSPSPSRDSTPLALDTSLNSDEDDVDDEAEREELGLPPGP